MALSDIDLLPDSISPGQANHATDHSNIVSGLKSVKLFLEAGEINAIGTLPTVTAADRGKIILLQGGAGVADQFHICIKNASDAYVWKQISLI